MDLEEKKKQLGQLLKIDEQKQKITEIEKKMTESSFWQDKEKARLASQRLSDIKKMVEDYESVKTEEDIERLEFLTLLSGEYDYNNALITIQSGAGGTEAQDWAEMLLRMYQRYAEKQGYQVKLLQESRGEEAGIKSATLEIIGPRAFGYLKAEAGVHRLVRFSPYDADKARHTSFALVEVIPEITEGKTEQIPDKDLRIDVFRSSGHGGQSVNTTDSAVRITHLPTGIVVACQNERSQSQNKATALKILLSRLNSLKLRKHKKKIADLKGEFQSPEWGSQIRSYVLHPYKQVKDHRTGFECKEPDKVLDGDLQGFIESYLKFRKDRSHYAR
jgi:peptide chain release factor 2